MSSKKPLDISSFDEAQFNEWIESFDVVLSDCDGVLWLHDHLLEGSNDVINKFTALGKKVYLITNNSQTTREEMAKKCKKMNFDLEEENMVTASNTTARYMQDMGFDKKAYVVGPKALVDELEAVGITTIGSGQELMDCALPVFVPQQMKKMDPKVGAVVVGFDQDFSFPKLFKAVNYLRNPNVKFIATNGDEKFEFPQFTFPDTGPLIAAIEMASGRKVTIAGKPSKILAEMTLKHENHRDSNRFLMIGDRLNTDVLFGKNNKFQTLLVGTGEHNMTDVEEYLTRIDKGEKELEQFIPDFYIKALKGLFDPKA